MTYVKPEQEYTIGQAYMMSYLRTLADQMRLRDWDLVLLVEEDGESSTNRDEDEGGPLTLASMTAMPDDLAGGLRYNPMLEDYPGDELRKVLVHELLHLHFDRAQKAVDFDGQLHLSEKDFAAFHFHFEIGIEQGINAVTKIVAPFMPLPQVREAQA